MKKFLLFLLPVMALSLASCEKNNEKELSGDDVIEFKDPNFFKALLENGVDSNRDGVITVNEAMAVVTALTIMECNVSDITEIKYFKSLEFLECIYNNLTTLDLSENTALELLDCFTNELTSINVSKNTALTWLDCGDNKLDDESIQAIIEEYGNIIEYVD